MLSAKRCCKHCLQRESVDEYLSLYAGLRNHEDKTTTFFIYCLIFLGYAILQNLIIYLIYI